MNLDEYLVAFLKRHGGQVSRGYVWEHFDNYSRGYLFERIEALKNSGIIVEEGGQYKLVGWRGYDRRREQTS